jgi:F-type H+-transporting ATPase subunit epsilon
MEPDQLLLEVVTPDGPFLKTAVEMVEFPSSVGELGILPGHIPMLVDLAAGELRIYRQGRVEQYAVAGGFVEIAPARIRVLATFASHGGPHIEIDAACHRARLALETAATEGPAEIAAELADLRSELLHLAQDAKRKRRR